MPTSDEVTKRANGLEAELTTRAKFAHRNGKINHGLSLAFMEIALACSVIAGALGIFTKVSSHIVGILAVMPPLIAYVAITLKLDAKTSWHFRKELGLRTLKSRLLFQLPETVLPENVAAIAKDWDKLNAQMQREWDETLAFNWASLTNRDRAGRVREIDSSEPG